jgi:replication factor C subunit 3/5
MTTLPWIEKYRPDCLDKIISHQNIVLTLRKYLIKNTLPNLILFGSPGTGKTSMIKACANELYGKQNVNIMTLEINASEERGIDVVRSRITQFANSRSTFSWGVIDRSTVKLVILDEADSMTFDAQIALKNTIDTYSRTTRFCLMCNCIKKIHYSLISRCIRFRLRPLPKTQIFVHVGKICKIENINITDDAISEIIKYSHGDMRRVVNVLQSVQTAYQTIDIDCINKYLNQIPSEDVSVIMGSLVSDNIKETHEKLSKLIFDNGFSFYELILSINNIIIGHISQTKNIKGLNKINNDRLLEIIKHLGKIEYQIFSNVNMKILIASLVGSFKMS